MRISLLTLIMISVMITACEVGKNNNEVTDNPFFKDYETPFETPPFDKIELKHYMPAYEKALADAQQEIVAIANNPDPATFDNTIKALEQSGKLLDKVNGVFFNLTSANTNDSLTAISKEVSPMLSKHDDDIYLNENLFNRIKSLWEGKNNLNLNQEQERLLEKYYKNFVRGGANLNEAGKEKLRSINKELSLLSIEFGENVRKENNNFELVIENASDLTGLPETVVSTAAETAKEKGKEGSWVFTINKPSMIPFLTYSDKRDLREKIYMAYINVGNNNDEFDNKEILKKMANLRLEKAQLLGYNNHSEFILEKVMAGKPDNVYDLLDQLWKPALKMAKNEADLMQEVLEKQQGYHYLDSPPCTITAKEHRPPYGSDGDYFSKPNPEDVFETIYNLIYEAEPGRLRFPL